MQIWLLQIVFGIFLILRSLPLLQAKLPKRYPPERVKRLEERGHVPHLTKRLFFQEVYLGAVLIGMGLVHRFNLLETLPFAIIYGLLFIPYIFLSVRFYHELMQLSEAQ